MEFDLQSAASAWALDPGVHHCNHGSYGAVPLAEDGLGAWHHRLAPGERLTGPDPAGGEGQFWVVADGTLRTADGALPRLSLVFVGPEEPAFAAEAGEAGAEVVLVQYPRGRDHVAAA
jgi:hypothetical protein